MIPSSVPTRLPEGLDSHAWLIDGLSVAETSINDFGQLLERVELVPGVNHLFAETAPRSSMELLFVDDRSGLPAEVDQVAWISTFGCSPLEHIRFVERSYEPGSRLIVDNLWVDFSSLRQSAPMATVLNTTASESNLVV